MTPRHRRLATAAAVIVISALGWIAPAGAGATATATAAGAASCGTADHERCLHDLLNQLRAASGVAPLPRDPALDSMARDWSTQMARGVGLVHRPSRGQILEQITPGWSREAENIGVGFDIVGIHDAFARSSGHRTNMIGAWSNRVGIGVVRAGDGRFWVTVDFVQAPGPLPAPSGMNAWLASRDGRVRAMGTAPHLGDAGHLHLWQPIVGMAPTRSRQGYWLVARDGGIFTYGDARFHGSTGGLRLNAPIVGMAPTPSGQGYWLVASDGGIFTYGDARFYGSTGGIRLRSPIIGMAPTPSGRGHWLVASDGGVFNYGDARFYGSAGGLPLVQPVVSIVPTATGRGYWLIARDGGVFTYGDATFLGSAAGRGLSTPVVGALAAPKGNGYWVFTSDGRTMGFGVVASSLGPPLDPTGSVAFVVPR